MRKTVLVAIALAALFGSALWRAAQAPDPAARRTPGAPLPCDRLGAACASPR